ncbi:MAG: hypothetical protein ACK4MV_20515 [Beijerinckiaceae bacterium]
MIQQSALRRVTLAAGLLIGGAAIGQTPTTPPDQQAPPTTGAQAAQKPAEEESSAIRIRGLVESADAAGVTVQLSKGLSVRVDIAGNTPVYSVARIAISDLQSGAALGVRTRAAQGVGENTRALEVLSLEAAPAEQFPGMNVNGAFKSIDKSGENTVLIVSEKGADRRLTVTPETSIWRLRSAALKDVKPGVSISVLVARDATGEAGARRAVFGSPPPGTMLPL